MAIVKKIRSSNLELYRIICMLMIVAHHFVTHSGFTYIDGPLTLDPTSSNSLYLSLLGGWGKTGINCFLMITGYFMVTSNISFRKYLKLLLQIYFYLILFFFIFLANGYESTDPIHLFKLFIPFSDIKNNFVGCYLIFYLTIPFWNILIRNMTGRQHLLLLILLLTVYTFINSIPGTSIQFNYVTWFGVIYLIASYIRIHPRTSFERCSLWGWLTLISVVFASISIIFMQIRINDYDFFMNDCNKLFAVIVSVCSFLWFKNLKIKYNTIINSFGAATFGVFLIHDNSSAMRAWLWRDLYDFVSLYHLPLGSLILYSIGIIIIVFLVCNIIDQIRIATFEKMFFNYYDKKISAKIDKFLNLLF